jgi:DNA-binding CsgD family transcriptional regulator
MIPAVQAGRRFNFDARGEEWAGNEYLAWICSETGCSPREAEVARLCCEGLSYAVIGARLGTDRNRARSTARAAMGKIAGRPVEGTETRYWRWFLALVRNRRPRGGGGLPRALPYGASPDDLSALPEWRHLPLAP